MSDGTNLRKSRAAVSDSANNIISHVTNVLLRIWRNNDFVRIHLRKAPFQLIEELVGRLSLPRERLGIAV
jgi:hypothetical protein